MKKEKRKKIKFIAQERIFLRTVKMKAFIIISIVLFSCSVNASELSGRENEVEPRGKAGKYALISEYLFIIFIILLL